MADAVERAAALREYSEHVASGARQHTHTAHVVFVAIDPNRRPKRVPRLVPETADERVRYAEAEERYYAQTLTAMAA